MSDFVKVSDVAKDKSSKSVKNPSKSHPKVSVMVQTAIENLKDRHGSSVSAIKKYIAENYDVEMKRYGALINKYLKRAVINGTLLQIKGKGASGSFKLKTFRNNKKSPIKTKSKKEISKPKKQKSMSKAMKASKVKKQD